MAAKWDIKVVIRYIGTITNEMRLIYDSEYYNITSVSEIGRKDEEMIFATKMIQT